MSINDPNYHRIILESINGGIQIAQMVYNEGGEPIDYIFLDVNSVFSEIIGLSKEEIIGKKATDFSPYTEPIWFAKFEEIVKKGTPERFEKFNIVTGSWYDALVVPLGDDIFAIIGTDVKERKIIEDELMQSKERLAFLLKLTDILRSTSNPFEVHATVTSTTMDFFKSDRCFYCEIEDDTAIIRRDSARSGLPSVSNVYPLSSLPIQKSLIESGQPFVVHDVNTTDLVDEELRQLCIQLSIISYIDVPVVKEGKAVGLLCIVQSTPRIWTDAETQLAVDVAERTWITVERVKAAEALQKSQEKALSLVEDLKKADKNKDDFMNMLSHELRNPLATIASGIMLLEFQNKNEKGLDTIHILKRQTEHLSKLVDDLLDIGRISQKKVVLNKETIELNEIVKDAIEDMKPDFEERSINLTNDIIGQTILVNVDPLRITQCILNILRNALKFTEEIGTVNISLKVEENTAVIGIQDNGIGISPEILPSIFEPFKQDLSSYSNYSNKGLGLGLSIVKDFVEMHDGQVMASSPGIGQGSTFTIRLPI